MSTRITEVPEFTNSSIPVYEVTLNGCDIEDLPADVFAVLNVQRIDLGNNPLRNIDTNAFRGIGDTLTELMVDADPFRDVEFPAEALSALPNLRQLSVGRFNIPAFESGALSSLTNLEDLSVTNCKLAALSPDDFQQQRTTLEVLHLESNLLFAIPTDALAVLSRLKRVDLTLNAIRGDIPENAFINNAALEKIDLSNNHIERIHENAFYGITRSLKTFHMRGNLLIPYDLSKIGILEAVEDLDLSYNTDLTSLGDGAFRNMRAVTKLNMHGCGLRKVDADSFDGLSNLVVLQIAENNIRSIATGAFARLTKLEDLYLDHQPLGDVLTADTFAGLEGNLKELSLQETEFSSQNWPAVQNLAKLTTLKLSDNQIDTIPDFTFQKLSQLQSLYLSENTITSISQRAMTGPQASLTSVSLNKNLLTTLDECTFDGFTQLTQIGLSQNPLHCDCHLKWLRQWVDDYYPKEVQIVLQWTCDSPDEFRGDKFVDLTADDLDRQCSSPPPPKQCETFTSTTSTTTTTTTTTPSTTTTTTVKDETTSAPSPTRYPLLVNVSDVTTTTCMVQWFTDFQGSIENFVIDVTLSDSSSIISTHDARRSERQIQLEDLQAGTDYKTCVTMWVSVDGVLDEEIGCVDFTTQTTSSPISQEESSLSAILGAVFGILGVLVLVVFIIVFVLKCRGQLPSVFSKCTERDKSSSSGLPSDRPAMGYNSKRFSKAKATSQEIHNQNMANKNIEHFKNNNFEPSNKHIDLQKDLERFTPEERERILNMLTHTGGSHLSTISVGSQRYVPEPPPRPPGMDGYLEPQAQAAYDGDAGYEEPHTYVEIDDQPQISNECYI